VWRDPATLIDAFAFSATGIGVTRLVTIALDAMGGDHGPSVVVPAALDYLARDPDVQLVLVGRERLVSSRSWWRTAGDRR